MLPGWNCPKIIIQLCKHIPKAKKRKTPKKTIEVHPLNVCIVWYVNFSSKEGGGRISKQNWHKTLEQGSELGKGKHPPVLDAMKLSGVIATTVADSKFLSETNGQALMGAWFLPARVMWHSSSQWQRPQLSGLLQVPSILLVLLLTNLWQIGPHRVRSGSRWNCPNAPCSRDAVCQMGGTLLSPPVLQKPEL